MKKIVVLVIALVLLLGVAPWGIGRMAEQRVNAGLDRFIEQAPYLSIVERQWTSGWFRSEQQVTFEVLGPWLEAMNRAAARDDEDGEVDEEAYAQGDEDVEDADAASEDAEADDADDSAAPIQPIRFSIRNEILHGPVLWPASIGLVRINTRLVLSDEVRQKLVDFLGTDEPVRMSTRVGFFGGGNTNFRGEGRTVTVKGEPGSFKYEDFELDFGYSKNFDDIQIQGDWPGFEVSGSASGASMQIRGLYVVGESERVLGELYDGNVKFAVKEIRFVDAEESVSTVEDMRYEVGTEVEKGFFDVSARLGTGRIRNPALEQIDLQLDEVHYDFTLRHLHAETLNALAKSFKGLYSRPVTTVEDVDAAILEPFREHGIALLEHDPALSIDRIGVVTPEGEAYLKGVIRLVGVTEEDLANNPMGMLAKLEADMTIEAPLRLIEKAPNGATTMGVALDQGFARREGEKLVSRIVFKGGELKVNDKPVPLPGLGGGGPGMDDEDDGDYGYGEDDIGEE